jgi:GTP-binding protein
VDLPGYGYAKTSHRERRGLQALVRDYLANREALAGAVWLLDVRRDPSPDDLAVGAILDDRQLPVLVAVTKADKFGRGRRAQRARTIMETLGIPIDQCVITSAHTGDGIEDLRKSILHFVATSPSTEE